MWRPGLLSAFILLASAFAADPIPREEYHARRAEFRKKLDGVLVLFGRSEGPDEVYRAAQDSNFYYLTGWSEPGAPRKKMNSIGARRKGAQTGKLVRTSEAT